ncbi:hypothetical protein PVK06_017626 [Gossypium arboreum]|uniref:Uncharacterized protein n=1 Tax=Gossypium arboreum TaxID=29729 RepID=A0ABR0Q4C9_GOSAR|nr:hypothetical protein PVK06_017626 [Gossypium arboreum]
MTKHPTPYKLQWLNDGGELKVAKQAIVAFSIGRYQDAVVCDVVPMHIGHLLLWCPWLFDRCVIHDGYTNRYTFKHLGKNVTQAPLTPKQVYQDQIKLKESVEKAKEKEQEKKIEKEKEKKNEKKKGKSKRVEVMIWGQITSKGGDDATLAREATIEPIQLPQGPITRSRAKKFQDALVTIQLGTWTALKGAFKLN